MAAGRAPRRPFATLRAGDADATSQSETEEIERAVRRGTEEAGPLRSELVRSETTLKTRGYLAELAGRGTVPSERLDELARRAKAGDPAAREELIEALLPRIAALAREYRAPGLEYVDLVQEGCVGLLRAVARYEPERGTPFWAYASWWVRQALQELRSHFLRPLRLPPKALAQLSLVRSRHASFYARTGREPTLAELSSECGLEEKQVEALLRADRRARSLADPLQGGEEGLSVVGDLLEDPLSAAEYEEILDRLAGRQVCALLGRLTAREREIVAARFGLGDGPGERLSEIGRRLGVSAERVRQLEEMGLAKLRRAAGS